MDTKVTVIIPAFNEASKIQRCIDSLLSQSVIPNIIVVNDGSSDETVQKVEKYKKLSNFLLINQLNQGVSVARNHGIKVAKTEYITFVDADDYVEKDFIKTLLDGFVNHNNIDLSVCNYSMKKLNNNITFYGKFRTSILNQIAYFDSVIGEKGINGFVYNKLFRKSIIEKYSIHFDPNISIGEDFLFCFLYGGYCKKVFINDSVQIHYIPTTSGVSDTMQIRGRFSAKIIDYFYANLKIVNYLKSLDLGGNIQKVVNEEICRTCLAAVTIVRKVYLYNQKGYYDEVNKMKTFVKNHKLYITKSKKITTSDKLKVLMLIYSPWLLKQLDRVKYKKQVG